MRLLFLPLIMVLLMSASPSRAIVNPHYTDSCGSCHIQEPSTGPDGEMDYKFLAEDIDPTCLICHEQNCCTIAKPHERTHASGIDDWDRDKYGTPEILPLSDEFITCATCHFWRRANNPKPDDYKLLRLVEIQPNKIDWTSLCQDCHKHQ